MSQQLLPSNQFGPSRGGAMTAGLRVCTVTGATFSVMVAGISGGDGFGIVTLIVWIRSAGMVADLSSATSSQTSLPGRAPISLSACASRGRGSSTPSLSPASVSSVWSPAAPPRTSASRSCEHVRQQQLVREMVLAVGGGHRHGGGDHARETPASGPRVGVGRRRGGGRRRGRRRAVCVRRSSTRRAATATRQERERSAGHVRASIRRCLGVGFMPRPGRGGFGSVERRRGRRPGRRPSRCGTRRRTPPSRSPR